MSLYLGKHVRTALLASDDVTELVDNRVYPVVALQGVPSFPFVRYTTEVTGADYVKGSGGLEHVEDHCTMIVDCVAKSYDEAIALQAAVREALECVGAEYTAYTMDPAEMVHADCEFDPELVAFVAEIQFTTNTQA